MKNKTHKITQSGLDKLQEELDYRINVKSAELDELLYDAIAKGDISENEAYEMTLDEKETNGRRIAELQDMIATAEVVEETTGDTIAIGSKVLLKMKEKEIEYHIVGASEGNPLENKISEETPIGKALVGKKKGDTIKVDLPMGEVEYEIVDIN